MPALDEGTRCFLQIAAAADDIVDGKLDEARTGAATKELAGFYRIIRPNEDEGGSK